MAESISLNVLIGAAAPGNRPKAAPDGQNAPPPPSIEISRIHDFIAKLRQPETIDRLRAYVRWQADLRSAGDDVPGAAGDVTVPPFSPVSINLDLTTACNFACDHCVDMDILNKPIKYDHERLLASLEKMAATGLKSVIVIGGGEPTVYPKFADTIRFMKRLGLQVSIVSNGSYNHRIEEIADCLEESDWVRLSLDSGSDKVFQAMHKPKRPISLDEICAGVPKIRTRNPKLTLGFSFIITWKGTTINDSKIVENLHEMADAARRARDHAFSYIAFKPFLTRAEGNNAEVIDARAAQLDAVKARIREQLAQAEPFETPAFRIYRTTNLKAFLAGGVESFTRQPHQCHMQFFRQVLSPFGVFNCPVYRNQPHGRLGPKDAYADEPGFQEMRRSTGRLIAGFDATHECSEVTCLYNTANWTIEHLIANPHLLDTLEEVTDNVPDYFL